MYGLDGNSYGNCVLYPNNDFECGDVLHWSGYRKLRCLTAVTVLQNDDALKGPQAAAVNGTSFEE